MKKIYLVGNPNVGKSAIFSRLTGVKVITSNYPGTTVEFSKGFLRLNGMKNEVVDIPGTYSMHPTSKAEEVATQMLDQAATSGNNSVIVNVIDATNLERNLNLTLQLMQKNIPLVIALNFWDETRHVGVDIDVDRLERILGVPVITTSGISGEGINHLVSRLKEAKVSTLQIGEQERWNEIGSIVSETQTLSHHHHTLFERIADISIHPIAGLPLAVLVLFGSFAVIRLIGENLITFLFEPLFEKLWAPVLIMITSGLEQGGFFYRLLLGNVVSGQIDFVSSLGLLTTGLFVPLGMVLPYVFSFYFVLSFLEDSGYLPRLGVLLDNLMHKLGIHGLAIVPMLLGIGCNVPGAMATRILETRKEKFITMTLMAIAVPCMAQTAMIFGLVGAFGIMAIAAVFAILLFVWVVLGIILRWFVKGESPEIFVEIPPYRFPNYIVMLKKLWMRTQWFIKEAVPFVLLGVLMVNILYFSGIINFFGSLVEPLITGLMGLPKETVGALIVGFMRKDVAVGMLVPLGLTMKQMIIASVILTMYFPCIATFMVLIKELRLSDMFKATLVMMTSTITVGTVLNLVL